MVQANAAGTVTSFKYEALGQRASEALCTGTTTYSYFSAGWQDLEDDSAGGSSTTKRTYVWGLGYIDDLVERDETIGSGSATRLYVQQDAGFNVTALVNTAGTVVERFVYDPYGAATVLTNSWTTTTDSYNWAFRWKGGRYDSATGLYNFRFRDYSPTLGRWMQNDPAGYVNGANLYQAVLGQPIDMVDPSGLDAAPTLASSSSTGSGSAGAATDPNEPIAAYHRDLAGIYHNNAMYQWKEYQKKKRPENLKYYKQWTEGARQQLELAAEAKKRKIDVLEESAKGIANMDKVAESTALGVTEPIGLGAGVIADAFIAPFRLIPGVNKELPSVTKTIWNAYNEGQKAIWTERSPDSKKQGAQRR